MNSEAPTFDNWSIWPFEYDQRLTTLCNQIVFTAEIRRQINDDRSQLTEYIRSNDLDALIEVRYFGRLVCLTRCSPVNILFIHSYQ